MAGCPYAAWWLLRHLAAVALWVLMHINEIMAWRCPDKSHWQIYVMDVWNYCTSIKICCVQWITLHQLVYLDRKSKFNLTRCKLTCYCKKYWYFPKISACPSQQVTRKLIYPTAKPAPHGRADKCWIIHCVWIIHERHFSWIQDSRTFVFICDKYMCKTENFGSVKITDLCVLQNRRMHVRTLLTSELLGPFCGP